MGRGRGSAAVRWVAARACLGFGGLASRLPLGLARGLGRALGGLAYYVVPRVRRVGLANLDAAYGDALSRREKARILWAAVGHVGMAAAEFVHLPRLTADHFSRYVDVKGIDRLPRDRATVILAAHIGNWEWMASVVQHLGFPAVGVVRPLDDPRLDAYIERVRTSQGVRILAMEGAGAEVVRLLRSGRHVGILADQSPRTNGVPVRFFGQACWATAGPALAALRAGVPIYLMTMVRGGKRYTLEIHGEVPVTRTGDLRRDVVATTQACQDAIEAVVRAHPDQWLWVHRRWKPRPRLEREWAERQ